VTKGTLTSESADKFHTSFSFKAYMCTRKVPVARNNQLLRRTLALLDSSAFS